MKIKNYETLVIDDVYVITFDSISEGKATISISPYIDPLNANAPLPERVRVYQDQDGPRGMNQLKSIQNIKKRAENIKALNDLSIPYKHGNSSSVLVESKTGLIELYNSGKWHCRLSNTRGANFQTMLVAMGHYND